MTLEERIEAAAEELQQDIPNYLARAIAPRILLAAYPELHGDKPTHVIVPLWFFVGRVSHEAFEWARLEAEDIAQLRKTLDPDTFKTFAELKAAHLHRPSDKGENT